MLILIYVLCILAAHEIGILFSTITNFIAAAPFGPLLPLFTTLPCMYGADTDFDWGLPHLFWCLGSNSLIRVLEQELIATVFGKAFDTIIEITAIWYQTTVSFNKKS